MNKQYTIIMPEGVACRQDAFPDDKDYQALYQELIDMILNGTLHYKLIDSEGLLYSQKLKEFRPMTAPQRKRYKY